MINKYDDIINYKRPISKTHVKMPISNRAAQFVPFAVLSGHYSSIIEAARIIEKRMNLCEEELDILNRKMLFAINNPNNLFKIIYFKDDDKKSGGKYIDTISRIIKFNEYNGTIIIENKEEIKIKNIFDIKSNLYDLDEIC